MADASPVDFDPELDYSPSDLLWVDTAFEALASAFEALADMNAGSLAMAGGPGLTKAHNLRQAAHVLQLWAALQVKARNAHRSAHVWERRVAS